MEIHFDDEAFNRLTADIAKSVESTLNEAIVDAAGMPLDGAMKLVHDRLRAAKVEPNDDMIRDQLTKLGFV